MLFDEMAESYLFEKELLTKNVENIQCLQTPIEHPIIITRVKGSKKDDDNNPLASINLRQLMNNEDIHRKSALGL